MNCVTKKIQKNNKRTIKYNFLREPEHHTAGTPYSRNTIQPEHHTAGTPYSRNTILALATGLPAWQPNNFGSMPGSNKGLFCSGSCPEPLQNTTKKPIPWVRKLTDPLT